VFPEHLRRIYASVYGKYRYYRVHEAGELAYLTFGIFFKFKISVKVKSVSNMKKIRENETKPNHSPASWRFIIMLSRVESNCG
jgi:hypothetical protein